MRRVVMATKVEKRKVRKEKNLEALGIDTTTTKKEITEEEKKHQKEEAQKWLWFFISIGLLWFIYTFYQPS